MSDKLGSVKIGWKGGGFSSALSDKALALDDLKGGRGRVSTLIHYPIHSRWQSECRKAAGSENEISSSGFRSRENNGLAFVDIGV